MTLIVARLPVTCFDARDTGEEVAVMPASDDHLLLRVGSGAAILGAVSAGVGNLLHPITPRNDPSGVARVIAEHFTRHLEPFAPYAR